MSVDELIRKLVKEEVSAQQPRESRVYTKWTAGEKMLLTQEIECAIRVIAMLHMRNPRGILEQIDRMRGRGSFCAMFPNADDHIFENPRQS